MGTENRTELITLFVKFVGKTYCKKGSLVYDLYYNCYVIF